MIESKAKPWTDEEISLFVEQIPPEPWPEPVPRGEKPTRRQRFRANRKLVTQATLNGLFYSLPERDRLILSARYLSSKISGLVDLGKKFGVSKQRIWEVEQRALSALKGPSPLGGQR